MLLYDGQRQPCSTYPPGVGEYGSGLEGPDKACGMLGRQMMLPLHHGGRELHMQSYEVSDAAFVVGAGQVEGRPAAFCPLQGGSSASVRERWSSLH